MIISMIAAMSEERVIGRFGELPWHLPADLARFKSITLGHTLLMGRRTYDSIGHPLPGRRIIVLTHSVAEIPGCQVARSLPEAIAAAEGEEEIFICGGAELFREALPCCQRIYLTIVHASYQGDTFFPELPDGFQELHREELPESSPPLSFLVFEKVARIEHGADVRELRQKGVEAMQRKLYFLARRCFEQALALEESPEVEAELAFCLAKSGADVQEALAIAQRALEKDPENTRICLNLGRLLIMGGAKERGLATLRKGMQLGDGPEILAELNRCGTRTPSVIRSLPRNHPLNRYLGILMHRLGLR